MAQINFKAFMARANGTKGTSTSAPKVSYFSLKKDQDEAIVRFMIDSPEDFDIVVVHQAKVGNFNRSVNCIRSAQDPIENCPLCEAGYKIGFRFYIRLIEYLPDEQGNIVGVPKIWERSSMYVQTFNDLLQEYGKLSDCVFKVKRNGATGSKDTVYSILFANQRLYEGPEYAKIPDAFKGYKVLGHAVVNKNFEELQALLSELGAGSKTPEEQPAYNKPQTPPSDMPFKDFPQPNQTTTPVPLTTSSESAEGIVPKTSSVYAPRTTPVIQQPVNNPGINNNGFGRPRRFY